MDVIMRNDVVESARAGDKMIFSGSLIVVPDISAVSAPGERTETRFGEPSASAPYKSSILQKFLAHGLSADTRSAPRHTPVIGFLEAVLPMQIRQTLGHPGAPP